MPHRPLSTVTFPAQPGIADVSAVRDGPGGLTVQPASAPRPAPAPTARPAGPGRVYGAARRPPATETAETAAGAETPADPPAAGRSASVVRAGALSMLALLAVGLTRLVHGSLTSHATDRERYGLVGIMLAASMIASLLLPGGVSAGMSKFVAFHRGAADLPGAWAVHRFLSRLGLFSSLLLGLVTALVLRRLHPLDAVDTVSVAVLTASYALYTVDKSAMYGHGLVPRYARIELGTSVLAVAATVAVIVTGRTFYLLPLCLGYGCFVLLARREIRRHRRREAPGAGGAFDRRQVLSFAVLASVGTLASAGFLQATQLLAGHFAAPAEVAYLVAAVALIAPLWFLPRAMALALFPAMAGAHGAGDHSAVRQQVDVSTRALAVVMTPVFLVGLATAPLVLQLFGGGGYAGGAPVLRLMLCASSFGILQVPAVNALASGSARQSRVPVASAVLGCLVGLAVVAVAAGPLGAVGVGLGYLVGTAVTALVPVVTVWRLHRLAWAGTLARCLVLMAAGMLLASLGPVRHWSWPAGLLAVGAPLVALALLRREVAGLLAVLRGRRPARTI
ncbi:lipopolysaccharide biosynthesis protein [Micromonospora mirobrigensis]|uniref:Membrane protein involved in the export of O-antigen and teichoic acid n=1 Tax=Micromonospora mirobrigensis TaxID=262898 RepID=A0A1C4U9G2_9ACTN|nr:lipopolysaccharide biosynthesis protein [Micromonospora mirobrigensis]SCE68277.1 Membrane protein involved in the export of O-antigen and teichoic acid [Micromonospora mirobrigensis]